MKTHVKAKSNQVRFCFSDGLSKTSMYLGQGDTAVEVNQFVLDNFDLLEEHPNGLFYLDHLSIRI